MASEPTLVTVLVENTANQQGLLAEHGLAMWIERGGQHILFDTGQGMALVHNAEKLGIDLSTADELVLSHGHYDHTGGLLAAMQNFRQATVYAHLTVFRERFIQNADGGVRQIGAPIESFDWLKEHVGLVVPTRTHPVEIADGLWLTGQIPRQNDFEDTGGAFFLDQACTQPDPVIDDQAVYFRSDCGLVVILGCAHAGVINTLEYICALTGDDRIHTVLGGMHLLHADEYRLQRTVSRLRAFDVQQIGLAHCTGFAAMARLHYELPNRCFHWVTGMRIDFE
jgi:7,8-dihydropterin-6-yl-methyl-4-(beta-D-ribofuranosyl)aminobenzene 5'-phosphate synthase